ncbi:leiomodin-3 [Centropristis striata]|uniref:leiomodin-3 n=1 Tax=Centropristis striata TaxID=184440 RepID=UPI0027DFD2D6|nr:leiomodin-3 [Centropristis striata]XP_059189496.1 leiomodin-3 [Centropristis striata]XP_059189497.1 leiomodin-3 [Centropristis striata]
MSDDRDLEELDEEDIDEDELLAMLSPEELKELQSEMDVIIAPDERVPVGQRQKDQTEKPPTGTFDHRSLVGYLYWEKESKRMLEEERVPATLLPSEKALREETNKEEDVEYEVIEEVIEEEAVDGTDGEEIIEIIEEIVEEVDETDKTDEKEKAVDVKTEEEVKPPVNTDKPETIDRHEDPPDTDIEKVPENRTDDNQSLSDTTETSDAPKPSTAQAEEKEEIKTPESSLPKEAPEINETPDKLPQKEEKKINKLKIPNLALNNIKMTSRPSGNETNLESTLDKMRNNNPSVTEVNLNNIENIPKEMLLDYVNALKKNKHVKTFSIANTGVDENIAYSLANMLRENRSITTLNIESNFVTGKGIVAIIRCLQFNETLTELRFHNQRHMLGHHAEMEISRLLKANNTLLKMGYHFEQPGPRMVVTNLLTRNLDRQRQLRKEEQRQQQVKEQKEMMQMYENSLNLPPGLLEMLGYIPTLELLQQHGLVPPSPEMSTVPEKHQQTERPEPPKQLKHNSAPNKQPSAEPAKSLKDVQLKRTPKKRDPFLDLDPRDNKRPERASFQLRKTPKVRDASLADVMSEKANLTDVIKTLKPVPRRREPAKVDPTPRDELLSQIKKSNVAYLKSVPLPKVLESSETSLL